MLHKSQFLLGAAGIAQLPPDRGREVAFAGRSNAGKSSAINALAQRRRLAFVSRTPGRTQQINYYALGAGCHLVDLPGYGFAQVPGALRRQWDRLLGAYLQGRGSLRGLVLLMDVRHPLTPLDRRLLDWFAPRRRPVLVLLTKADKLTRAAAQRQLREVRGALGEAYPELRCELFSSVSHEGVALARAFVADVLADRGEAQPVPEYNAPASPDRADVGDRGAGARLDRRAEKKSPRLKGKAGG
jgi:GTP-binding protein